MIAHAVRHLLVAGLVACLVLSATIVPAQDAPRAAVAKQAAPKPKVEDKAAIPDQQVEAVAKRLEVITRRKAAVAKAVAVPAAPVGGFAVDPAQKNAMLDNVLRQMRPVLRAEMHLIRNTCKPSKDEMAKIAKEGEKALKDAAEKAAETQLKMQQGIGVQNPPNVVEEIQRALIRAVADVLSDAQEARYAAEIRARAQSERDVAARMLVARFDPVLNLSAEQRAKIAASLAKSDNAMAKSLDNLMYANGYLPFVDDKDVVPYLDERQKTLWRDTQRVHFGTSFNYGIAGINLTDDDLAEEDDPEVAKELAKKRAANRGAPFLINGMIRALRVAPALPAALVPAVPAPKAAVKAAVK